MDATERWNISVSGPADAPVMLFAHGFGCDQTMWRLVAPAFEADNRVVLFDLAGFGGSDLSGYDPERYTDLAAYAEDVLTICHELDLHDVTFVGHSVAAMIGVLAHLAEPDRFASLVLVGPSARYLDDDGYEGGFDARDIADLLELMDSNHLGWQGPLAGMVMHDPARPDLQRELEATFCRARPDIARRFAEVTFTGDNREDLALVAVPTLVLQSRHDHVAPPSAGEFVHRSIRGSAMVVIDGYGHCPHLSSPGATTAAIHGFLAS